MSVPVCLFMPSREKPNRTFAFCKPVITHATRHDGGITVAEPRRGTPERRCAAPYSSSSRPVLGFALARLGIPRGSRAYLLALPHAELEHEIGRHVGRTSRAPSLNFLRFRV